VPIPSINLDCTELGEEDLDELGNFMSTHPGVKSFSYSVMADTDSDELMTADSPIIGLAYLTAQQWNAVTGGVTGRLAQCRAGEWVTKELEGWCAERKLLVRYDAECNLVPIQP
jgi:hypothetical protein